MILQKMIKYVNQYFFFFNGKHGNKVKTHSVVVVFPDPVSSAHLHAVLQKTFVLFQPLTRLYHCGVEMRGLQTEDNLP